MGIYDRDYVRREGPSFLGSFTERGTVCKWLIIINIGAFVLQMVTRTADKQPFTDAFVLDVPRVLHGEVWRLFTYAFLHSTGTVWHIVFNMLFLWWFGSDVEDLYGPREFLAIYCTSILLGGVAFVASMKFWYPPDQMAPCLGASGAVTTVLVLCAIHYPTRIIYLFFFLPVPIWVFVIFSVAYDAFGFLGQVNSGTAVAVHLAGAAFGFAYHKFNWRLMTLWPQLRTWKRSRAKPRLRVYREEESPTPVTVAAPAAAAEDEQLEAKMDAILEKISRTGKDSLTDSERQLLLRASEVFKRRRT
jgi:membrane associated rhomboid family serine protease